MTAVTYTNKGLTFAYDDGDITDLEVVLDLDMRTGTPVDETAWLDGGAAAGSYPGALDGFKAKNSNTTDANGSLRLVTVKYDLEAAATEAFTMSGAISKIVTIVGNAYPTADKTFSVTFSGLVVTSHAEAAADNCYLTMLILG
tara:strand:+ start:14034 stop:14462 length:429 start_codon:yes stop_codon:yes gene_type:complete